MLNSKTKTNIFKKTIISFLFVFLFLCFVLPFSVRAEQGWFYNIYTTNPTNTIKQGGFTTKEDCENALTIFLTPEEIQQQIANHTLFVSECIQEAPVTPINPIKTTNTNTVYTPLAPLPGVETSGCIDDKGNPCIDTQKSTANPCPFGNYLNIMFKLFLGVAGVLAVVMIVMGGVQYMTSDLVSSKEEGKKTITNAIFGLLIGLGAVLILNTINPNLLDVCLNNLPKAEIVISPETNEETIGITGKTVTIGGQNLNACDEKTLTTIAFLGKQVKVNKIVVPELQAINTAWQNSTDPAVKNYKINSVIGYACRSVRNQPNKTSSHAYGIAIDINPETNPFLGTMCKTDMPQPAFIKLFKDKGWGWGGNWSNPKDPMHFSKLPSEMGHNNPCND
jgi:hypothetical protein